MINTFFENIGFTIGSYISDIKPCEINISDKENLNKKLSKSLFKYDCPEQANTSFYLIGTQLSDEELFEVKRYIWNEDKYDLYFITEIPETGFVTSIYYAKTDPRINDGKIASFRGEDTDLVEKIGAWKFHSGAFWLSYSSFLKKVESTKKIDKKLVEQLKELKAKLQNELKHQTDKQDEIVQALIDRTLFIKFLEDNHIINSFFYAYHFPNCFENNDSDLGYKRLLYNNDVKNINLLFDKINKLFNSILFKTPVIKEEFLTSNVLNLIYQAIRQQDWKYGQLSLFDFRFDVIPIEFISHIYEVFLEKNQADEGIYYTPDKLAHLIVDDTINSFGSVMDPACGSGMFLILSFRKLLEYRPIETEDVIQKINYKNRLIKDNIFGIEKANTAWRLSIFSLYLEILKGIKPEEIKNYIKQKLENNSQEPIFPYDFSDNILCQNALEIAEEKKAHNGKTFNFIVGNPPFFEIKPNSVEISFLNGYETEINQLKIKSNEVIGYKQISQAFMLKIKDWAKPETRFGFVQNSSNFYNEKSENFRKFFFTYYQIENFYELSKVKDILFRKAKESVVVTIFNNKPIGNNKINYYPVDLGIFSKTFELLIIQDDKKIEIKQKDVLNEKIVFRDYLIGNEFDLKIISKLNKSLKIEKYISNENDKLFIHEGLKIVGQRSVSKHFNISKEQWKNYNRESQMDLFNKFKNEFTRNLKSDSYSTKYIESNNLSSFIINGFTSYMGDISKFERPRDNNLYINDKIIWNRTGGNIRACYIKEKVFFNFDIHVIKLKNNYYYYLLTAILNSELINYFLNISSRKRMSDSYPKISNDNFLNIPIPFELDEDLVNEISEISKQLTEGKLKYEGETKEKLNDLIYELYGLNILEINRIKDYYKPKHKVCENELEEYKSALEQTIQLYFESKPQIEYTLAEKTLPFGLVVIAIYFDNVKINNPTGKKTLQYVIYEILRTTGEKFLTMREKIFGKNCIYIIKDDSYHSWSTTKAFEDGQEILKKVIR